MRTKQYKTGNWALPNWWLDMPPCRNNKMSHAEQTAFYSGNFVVKVLKHSGGITKLPPTVKMRAVICS